MNDNNPTPPPARTDPAADDATSVSDLGSDAEWQCREGCVSEDEDPLDLLEPQHDDDRPLESMHPFKWDNADEETFVEDLRNPSISNMDTGANKPPDPPFNSHSSAPGQQHHQHDPNELLPPPPQQYEPPNPSASLPQTINPDDVPGDDGDDDGDDDDDGEYDADEYGDQFAMIPGYRAVSSRAALAPPASEAQHSSLSMAPPPPPPPQPHWADRPRDVGVANKTGHAPDSGQNSPSPARSRIARMGSDSSQGGSIGSGSGLRLSSARTSSSTGSAQRDDTAERKVSILRVSGTGTVAGSGSIVGSRNPRQAQHGQHVPQSHPQYQIQQHALNHETTSELSISDPDYQHNMSAMHTRGTFGLARSGSGASGASAASSQNQRQVQSLNQDAHQHRLSAKSDVGIYDRQGSELSASSALGSDRPVSSPPNNIDQLQHDQPHHDLQEMHPSFQMEHEQYVTHDGAFINHQGQYQHPHQPLDDSHPYMSYQPYHQDGQQQQEQHQVQAQSQIYSRPYTGDPRADDAGMVFSDSDMNSAYHVSSTTHGYSSDGRSAIDASTSTSVYPASIGNPRNQGGFRGATNVFGKRGPASNTSSSGLHHMSILECVVETLKGANVYRKKNFIHALQATVWLTPDLHRLQFRTLGGKRSSAPNIQTIELDKVTRLRGSDCAITIDATGMRKPIEFVFSTRDTSDIWFSGLSCLVPVNTNVKTRNSKVRTGHRRTYNPLNDSWQKKSLTQRKRIKEFILLGSIGRGSFGKVKLAISEKDHRFYAVKVLHKSMLRKRILSMSMAYDQPGGRPSDSNISLDDVNEVKVLRDLDHGNVMKLKDTYDDEVKDSIFIIIEYLARGPIMSSTKLTDASHILEDKARIAFVDVLCGLEYLHRNHVVHRDIKPDNLLQAGDGTVKISDFGAAVRYSDEYLSEVRKASGGLHVSGGDGPRGSRNRSMRNSNGGSASDMNAEIADGIDGGGDGNDDEDQYQYQSSMYNNKNSNSRQSSSYQSSYNPQYDGTTVGTPAFTAPELCLSEHRPECPPQCYSADIWSLGATLFYMLYGRAPFIAHSVFEMYDAICTRELEFPEFPPVSKHAQHLIRLMLDKKPERRASIDTIMRCQWLKDCSDVAEKLVALRTSLMSRPTFDYQYRQREQRPSQRQRRPASSSGVGAGSSNSGGNIVSMKRDARVSKDSGNEPHAGDEETRPNSSLGHGSIPSSTSTTSSQRFPQSKSLTNVNGTRLRPQR